MTATLRLSHPPFWSPASGRRHASCLLAIGRCARGSRVWAAVQNVRPSGWQARFAGCTSWLRWIVRITGAGCPLFAGHMIPASGCSRGPSSPGSSAGACAERFFAPVWAGLQVKQPHARPGAREPPRPNAASLCFWRVSPVSTGANSPRCAVASCGARLRIVSTRERRGGRCGAGVPKSREVDVDGYTAYPGACRWGCDGIE